jgi:serine/threonine protein kinase
MDAVQTLGKYEIRGTLGKGAMGTVYDGWDPLIARRVAIKTVSLPANPDPETAEEIARFRREAQAAGRLSHPNIVAVYDYGETNDIAYIVMEFVDGPSLKSPLDHHERFALADIQRIMDDLLAGLQFSHDHGVVHRDIKPANIMLNSEGRAKIADFGIARIERSSMTQAGTMLGTPAYMSPEQFMGQVVDARTDVYSAGVVLYQLLTGERPFEGGLTAIMHKVLNTEPPAPSELAVTTPSSLDAVVKRAMAKRPDERYPSASSFAKAIRDAIASAETPTSAILGNDAEATVVGRSQAAAAARATPAQARPGAGSPAQRASVPAPPPARSRVPLFAGIGVAVVLGLGAGGWFLLTGSRQPPAAASADTPPPTQTGQLAPSPLAQAAVPNQSGSQPPSPPTPPTQSVPPAETTQPLPSPPAQAAVPTQPDSQLPSSSASSSQLVSPPAASTPTAQSAPPARATAPGQPVSQPTSASPALAATLTPAAPALPSAGTAPQTAGALGSPAQPTADTAAQATATPPAAPPPIKEAALDLSMVRQQLRHALAQSPCTMANALVQDSGAISISGFASPSTAAALRQQVAGMVASPVTWHVQQVDPVFCTVLTLLRPISAQAGAPITGLAVTLANGITTLRDGDLIRPRITMADFPGELRVDYLVHDGSLVHLYPTVADPTQHVAAQPAVRLAPGAPLSLGEAGPGRPIWAVGAPYGTDMIVAIASSTPLLAHPPTRNAEDDAGPYLRELAAGVARVRQSGGKVAGTLLLVDTLPK